MAAYLSPIGNGVTFFTAQGVVLSGGKIFTYLAGTTTPSATYTDSTQVTQNPNPIILGSNGIAPQEIWLTSGTKYKFVVTDSVNNVLGTYDNLQGVNDITSTVSQWIITGLTPTFISSTSFSVVGDQTALFTPFRRFQALVNSGVVYGTVQSSVFSAGITTVTVSMDSLPLDSGLSSVNVSFLTSTNSAVPTNVILDKSVIPSKIQGITASVASNALTITYAGGVMDFRNATLTNGTPISNFQVSSNSITVPATATLGTISANLARIILIEAYNNGSPVLCVSNAMGGLNLDETNLISPTTISTGATSNAVIYSASAVSANSPYRVIGYIEITEATAGTWATAPSLIQGQGGQALSSLQSSGMGQTWQTFTIGTQRVYGTVYYNTTAKPIKVSWSSQNVQSSTYAIFVNGTQVQIVNAGVVGTPVSGTLYAEVPPGQSYQITNTTGSATGPLWVELR